MRRERRREAVGEGDGLLVEVARSAGRRDGFGRPVERGCSRTVGRGGSVPGDFGFESYSSLLVDMSQLFLLLA